MACDIVEHLYELYYTKTLDNVVFITVTGDRDLKYPIEKVFEKKVPVEFSVVLGTCHGNRVSKTS